MDLLSPIEKAYKYGNLLATAVNYNDATDFREALTKFCIPNLRVIKHCSTSVPDTSSIPAHSQTLVLDAQTSSKVTMVTSEYHGIDQYCETFRDFNNIVPDGVMEVYDHRCTRQSEECNIYVSCFRYSGTIMYLQSDRLFTQTVDYPLVQLCMQGWARPLNVIGTIAFHVSSSGYVNCIEVYKEYV